MACGSSPRPLGPNRMDLTSSKATAFSTRARQLHWVWMYTGMLQKCHGIYGIGRHTFGIWLHRN